jgi:hypothetical protein
LTSQQQVSVVRTQALKATSPGLHTAVLAGHPSNVTDPLRSPHHQLHKEKKLPYGHSSLPTNHSSMLPSVKGHSVSIGGGLTHQFSCLFQCSNFPIVYFWMPIKLYFQKQGSTLFSLWAESACWSLLYRFCKISLNWQMKLYVLIKATCLEVCIHI